MSNYLNVADQVKAGAKKLEWIVKLAEALQQVGSLEQAEQETQKRVKELGETEAQLKASLIEKNLAVTEAAERASQIKKSAEEKAAAILLKAESDAAAIRAKAEEDAKKGAETIVQQVTRQKALVDAAVSRALEQEGRSGQAPWLDADLASPSRSPVRERRP
jgi:ParB-like chromosome segregation protein Spo0J